MKTDIDRFMRDYNLDAIVILGGEGHNPYRDYLTGRAKAGGPIFKKRGEKAVFVVSGMEVEEAAKSGLDIRTPYDFDMGELFRQFGSTPKILQREMFLNYFRKLNITGRVAFFGVSDIAATLPLILALQDSTLKVEVVVGGDESDLFSRAYETKDEQELNALKEAARLTSDVVRRTWNFISQHFATGDAVGSPVVDSEGNPLTIGKVKQFIRTQYAELGLDDPDGCIFAQGRDAALPHSHGEDSEVLQVGKSIVFDIFPRGGESGYFHDMTRTWVLGHATPEVQTAYDQVMHIFHETSNALKVGEPTNKYQIMTLDYFESLGHPTQRSKPGTMEGYVHSLGHGLGMNIHESPGFGEKSSATVQVGNVVTIEPGLYYPDRGFGVRVEDTVYIAPDGSVQTLTDFPYDLVLPLRTK